MPSRDSVGRVKEKMENLPYVHSWGSDVQVVYVASISRAAQIARLTAGLDFGARKDPKQDVETSGGCAAVYAACILWIPNPDQGFQGEPQCSDAIGSTWLSSHLEGLIKEPERSSGSPWTGQSLYSL